MVSVRDEQCQTLTWACRVMGFVFSPALTCSWVFYFILTIYHGARAWLFSLLGNLAGETPKAEIEGCLGL